LGWINEVINEDIRLGTHYFWCEAVRAARKEKKMKKIHYGGGPNGPSKEAIQRARKKLAKGKFVSVEEAKKIIDKKSGKKQK